jgi:hypothetical protein
MDQNEFRKAKESGELVTDAALQDAETEIIDDQFDDKDQDDSKDDDQQQDNQDQSDDKNDDYQDDGQDKLVDDQSDDDLKLSPKEKTAFDKRLDRDKTKLEEKIRLEMEEQFKQKYSKHDEAIQLMGGDPDKILQAAKDAQLQREAQRLAEANDWSPEDTQWYIEDQKNKQELKELRVQMQINRLKDNPDYVGIASMEKDILSRIDKSNGALNVEEAFWALGGAKRVEQIKLEAQQREVAKRSAATRTVQKDTPSTTTGEKPLPANILREAERMGISGEEARRIMNAPVSQNIDEYRKNKAK